MPERKRDDQRPDDGQEANEGRPLLVVDQTSFIDEGRRTGRQFTAGRKVADLEHVGAMAPDADPEPTGEPPRRKP